MPVVPCTVRALLALRLLSEAESALPVTMPVGTLASSLSQSRRPAYLMVTADSSRSSQLLLLLTAR
jgi:hypothetical protein